MAKKFKFSGIFGLQDGIDPDDTWKQWKEDHVQMGIDMTSPEVKKYTIDRVIHRFGDVAVDDVWGISEFWYDSMEDAVRATERLQKATPDDFHTKRITPAKRMILEEEK